MYHYGEIGTHVFASFNYGCNKFLILHICIKYVLIKEIGFQRKKKINEYRYFFLFSQARSMVTRSTQVINS